MTLTESRRGSISIHYLILIIVGLLVVWFFVIPTLKIIVRGSDTAFQCDGECYASCPSDYSHSLKGDAWCAEQGGGGRCCIPNQLPDGGAGIRGGDIKVIYNNDKAKPLSNGQTVTLGIGQDGKATGSFSVVFGDSLKGKECYAQLGYADGSQQYVDPSSLFTTQPTDGTGEGTFTKKDCLAAAKSLKGTVSYPQQANLGRKVKYSILVINPSCETIEKYPELCDVSAFTFYAQVPDRQPSIALRVDGRLASPTGINVLTLDRDQQLEITITDPLATCAASYAPIDAEGKTDTKEKVPLSFFGERGEGVLFETTNCLSSRAFSRSYTFVPGTETPRAYPFAITISTSYGSGEQERKAEQTYRFQTEAEQRVTVTGPSPGLTRQKEIDIACDGVSCTGKFRMAPVKEIGDCKREYFPNVREEEFAPPNLAVQGTQGGGRWRIILQDESWDGRYVCVEAETADQGRITSIGLWNGLPTMVAIDATPPTATLDWDSWRGLLTLGCEENPGTTLPAEMAPEDRSTYTSGCAAKPYSYAYVTNEAIFVGSVLTGGLLTEHWNGCPDPYTGQWAQYNSLLPEMAYISKGSDVRVICLRARDSAGNADVESRLLYSSQEVLALLLQKYAQEAVCKGSCLPTCPSGYSHKKDADGWCDSQSDGSRCCVVS